MSKTEQELNMNYQIKCLINRKKALLDSIDDYDAIDVNTVKSIYEEAQHFFGDKVYKRLEDANKFYQNIHDSRKKRLTQEINDLTNKGTI